jgi:hypothetical protein
MLLLLALRLQKRWTPFVSLAECIDEARREELHIGIGDEVFMIGLFSHLKGKTKSLPISRTGNIALFPDERIPAKDHQGRVRPIKGFLVEARSIGGLSGSPVFARQSVNVTGFQQPGSDIPVTLTAYGSNFYLIGLVSAHWDIDPSDINETEPKMVASGVNMGFAIVVPAYQILDILEGEEFVQMRKKTALAFIERRKHAGAATLDWAGDASDRVPDKSEPKGDATPFTKADFEAALKKVARKIEPET